LLREAFNLQTFDQAFDMRGVDLRGRCRSLVQGLARGMLQPLDLVLNHQFPALQLDNLQIVCGKMH
jgi:hypothetical protein